MSIPIKEFSSLLLNQVNIGVIWERLLRRLKTYSHLCTGGKKKNMNILRYFKTDKKGKTNTLYEPWWRINISF